MYCVGCGRRSESECDGTCRRPLDPPRYCPACGKRLFVQVTPTAYTARCRKHGAPVLPAADPAPGD